MRILKRGAVLLVAGALVAHGIFLSMISSETLGICADRSGNLYHAVRFSFGWSQ